MKKLALLSIVVGLVSIMVATIYAMSSFIIMHNTHAGKIYEY